MTTILLVCAIVLTVAITVAVIFLVKTLIQVERTARQAETLLKGVNTEVSTVLNISEKVSGLLEAFSSPWVKIGTIASGVISSMLASSKKRLSKDAKAGCRSENRDEAAIGI
jgi:hypothetical protein